VVVAIGLSKSLFDASPRDALPLINDEVAYWNQIATFAAAGFSGGSITVDERTSRVAWSHFGPHGPAFALLYGLPAKVLGWGYVSGPLFGAVASIAGAGCFILMTRPPPLLTAALLASFWPVVVALPATMQEPLHYAIGCGLAPLLLRVLRDEERAMPRWSVLACAFALGVASLIRPVWTLLALPLGWYAASRKGLVHAAFGLGAGATFMGVLYTVFMTVAAPYPRGGPQLADLVSDPRDAIHRVIRRATVESPEDWLFKEAHPLERVARAELVAIALLTLGLSFRRTAADGVRRVDRVVASAIALLLAAVLTLGSIGSWQDFRSTMPVFLTLLLLCASTRPTLIWGFVVVQVLATPVAIAAFASLHDKRFDQARRDAVEEFARKTRPHIVYDSRLSPWGNTVLLLADRYQAPLMTLPPGVGASSVVYWEDVALPLRSRYVLLSQTELDNLGTRALAQLADTPIGQLFENLDWQR
jgi:hypothetical protein